MNYPEIINAYIQMFKRSNMHDIRFMRNMASNLYDAMYQYYDICWEKREIAPQIRICQVITEDVLPKLDKAIIKTKSLALANELLELRKKFFAMSARRNLKNYALYHEQYKSNKVWAKTMETVECIFHYMDIFDTSPVLNLLRASLMPSMGKSYIANLYVSQCLGNDPNDQLLRITYSDDLCITTTAQTESIINSRAFREIFPRYAKMIDKHIFKVSTKYQICMCDSENEYNLFAVTRDGQSTGKRAKKLIIDDLLKDDTESYNKTLHKKMVDRYDSTWTSRAEDDNLKILLLGTMWAPTDLLNVVYDRAIKDDRLIASRRYQYVEETKSGKSVFIGVPALDENDMSTCPKRYSSESLRKKRDNMSHFLWMCVYQQTPIPPDELDFDYSLLKQYEEVPKNTGTRYAALDPARKGKNYVSMPIFYEVRDIKNQYALVDFLYKKRSMKEMYDLIVDKIIEHRINFMVIENNTDTSLEMVISTKLHEKGYFNCKIIEKYSSENKEQRIKNNQGAVKGNIIYPKKGMYSNNTDIGKAMESATSYSFEYPNKFDDAIDSIVLFIQEFVDKSFEFSEVESFIR